MGWAFSPNDFVSAMPRLLSGQLQFDDVAMP